MKSKWVIIGVVIVAAYFVWRKFGSTIQAKLA